MNQTITLYGTIREGEVIPDDPEALDKVLTAQCKYCPFRSCHEGDRITLVFKIPEVKEV